MNNFSEKVSFIWSVADLLRGDYKQSEYGRVILPFLVLRRLDQVPAPTRKAVLTADARFPAGDKTVQASPEQIRALKLQGLMQSYESRPALVGLHDLCDDTVLNAQRGAGLSGLQIADYMVRRRLASWRGGELVLRQAAELLFAAGAPEHPNAGVRVFRVVGRERRTGIHHNVEELRRIEGAIAEVVSTTFATIGSLLRRPSRLGPDGRFRQVSEYPDFAWKEAILNAIAHRDYGILGRGVEVWLFDDRMEVASPGGLLPEVSIRRLVALERVHVSRNPRMVRCLVDLGFMRDQGEGIPRMFAEMEGLFLPAPELSATPDEVRVTLRNTPTLSTEDRAFVESLSGETLSEPEFRALLEARRGGRVHNARLRQLAGLDTLAASQLLRDLRDRGLLVLHAAGSASYYTLGDGLVEGVGSAANREELEADRGELEADRGELEADWGELEADWGELEADPAAQATVDAAGARTAGELTVDEQRAIAGLGRRPRKEKLRSAILMLARRRPWRPAELARALGRPNVAKLAERHLKPMVHDGLLRRTKPDNPTDPNQAYLAVQTPPGPLFDHEAGERDR